MMSFTMLVFVRELKCANISIKCAQIFDLNKKYDVIVKVGNLTCKDLKIPFKVFKSFIFMDYFFFRNVLCWSGCCTH